MQFHEVRTNFDPSIFGLFLGMICCSFVLAILINLPVAWLTSSCLKRLPPEYRLVDPTLCWLLLIPVLHLVWNFFVFPQLSQSYQQYFAAQGRSEIGDANLSLAWAYCIAAALTFVPGPGCIIFLASIVLLVIYLIKMVELRNQIPQQPNMG